jgi:hypothetical protein
MHSSGLAEWALGHRLIAHVVLPGTVSLVLMGMYFSGNSFLQSMIAPMMETVPRFSAREFGLLEMLQNVLLIGVCIYSIRCFMAADGLLLKSFALFLIVIGVFSFLEEIDYGAHFVEYFTGQYGSLNPETWDRNWHNRTGPGGVQNVSYMKFATNIMVFAGFVLGPLLLGKSKNRLIRLLTPSRWMISTVVLILLLSVLAHWLDDSGYAFISGTDGNLEKNISEFKELNMYYLFLLYTVYLYGRLTVRGSVATNHLQEIR